ncbi:family sulfate permease [Fusarium coicis]|nr:family sulfate permease [Fusarium coicis]
MLGHTNPLSKGMANILGIKLEDQKQDLQAEIPSSSSIASEQRHNLFYETEPTSSEWIKEQIPSKEEVVAYANSLFPFAAWISHYNMQWFAGDLVAGITIGAVVVPQGMAYAILANLDPQFGLYSSFIGPMIYWIFGTSKDISIGPVAVLSTVVGNVVQDVQDSGQNVPAHIVASALSIIAGFIVLVIGLLRCGWIVDLISITSLSAFMTGSAITICVGQLPALLGLSGVSNRDPPYKVLANTIEYLGEAGYDAIVGVSALSILYLIRQGFTAATERYPKHKRLLFFSNTMRFQNIRVPKLTTELISDFVPYLPATVIVLLVEHMAISKSFGRVNNYTIDPSQEMVSIGMANLIGPFLGAYPATGSFSRTAIQSKAGVRTPAAGIITGLVVLLATYLLTAVFFYIPNAALAAVIIHAVGDLVTPPNTIYQFWRVSPIEVFIFFTGVTVSVFAQIEDGLYATVLLSGAVFIYRILKAKGRFLGKVKVHSVIGDHVIGDDHRKVVGEYGTIEDSDVSARNVFIPLGHGDGSNPEVEVDHPYPGIFIYRFSEGFNYPNANSSLDYLTDFIQSNTQRSSPEAFERPGDRPWNNPGPRKSAKRPVNSDPDSALPTLKAVILDFSSVNNVDITSIQRLIDIRNQLDSYASPDGVDWHFSCIHNRWSKRALVSAGFGVPYKPNEGTAPRRWKSIFSVAEIGGKDSAVAIAQETDLDEMAPTHTDNTDEEPLIGGFSSVRSYGSMSSGDLEKQRRRGAVVHGLDKPLFHVDLTSALQNAITNVEERAISRETAHDQQLDGLITDSSRADDFDAESPESEETNIVTGPSSLMNDDFLMCTRLKADDSYNNKRHYSGTLPPPHSQLRGEDYNRIVPVSYAQEAATANDYMELHEDFMFDMASSSKLYPTDAGGLRGLFFLECSRLIEQREFECRRFGDSSKALNGAITYKIDFTRDRQERAIYSFILITIIFLPISAVSCIFGMIMTDVRDMNYSQWLYWVVAIPVTVLVIVLGLWFMGELGSLARWLSGRPGKGIYGEPAVISQAVEPAYRAAPPTTQLAAQPAEYSSSPYEPRRRRVQTQANYPARQNRIYRSRQVT